MRYDIRTIRRPLAYLIDEVDFWMRDGGKVVDRTVKDDKVGDTGAIGLAVGGSEEIKELVQDD